MRNSIVKSTSILRKAIPLTWLASRSPFSVIFPFYHLVSDNPPAHVKHLYHIKSVHAFEKDLDFLLKNYQPLSLKQVLNPENNKNKKVGFHLTFDDGLRECYDIIAPILLKKGIQATFFVNPEFVGNSNLFHRYKVSLLIDTYLKSENKKQLAFQQKMNSKNVVEELKEYTVNNLHRLNELISYFEINLNQFLAETKPYMDLCELKSLMKQGFNIGAHSMTHPEFYAINENNQLKEMRESIQWVSNYFEWQPQVFAFPFTEWGVKQNTIKKIKLEFDNLKLFGTAGLKNDDLVIQRMPMELENYSARQLIHTEYIWYYLKKIIGKASVKRM